MELVSHAITAPKAGQEILIMPVGDIQWSGHDDDVALEMLRRNIEWGVERGAYFLGMGDYIDYMSPSNRERYNAAGLYDTTRRRNDASAAALVEELYERALKPSKGRWLGLLEGHHFHEYRNGISTDQDLATRLDAPFIGTCAYVRLVLQAGKTQRMPVVIWCHHGVGSGTTIAAPLNKLERLIESWEADIYLMAHQHKKVSAPIDRIEAVWKGNGGPRVVHRTKIIACTGSFLKAYTTRPKTRIGRRPVTAAEYRGGYVEKAMMRPVALGGVLVKVRARWQDGLWLPDLNVEL